MNMTDDELLGAYTDGELSPDEAAVLEQRLAADADLQARLDALLATNDVSRRLFAEVDAQPMPEAVLNMLQEEPAKPDNVVPFLKLGAGRLFNVPVAIAASVALVVSFLVVDMSRQASGPVSSMEALSAKSIAADSALHDMLEDTNSGHSVDLGNDETGEAVLSFTDVSGRYCRQLRVGNTQSAAHAVACRGNSAWQVEALAIADPAAGGQFQQAGSATPVAIMTAVDALIGAAEPLDTEQEKQAISNSWKKSE